MKRIGLFITALILATSTHAISYKRFVIENRAIDESSGLAHSSQYDHILWTHNDSGDAAIIYAMDYHGIDRGSFFLEGVNNRDWEDMASFRWNDQSYLMVADTGDNFRMFLSSYLHFFQEPRIEPGMRDLGSRAPVWSIEYTYEGGGLYDVEAVAVDIVNQQILLLTKRTRKTLVFQLPLRPDSNASPVLQAKLIAQLDDIQNPSGMDITPDGKQAVILTYGRVFRYEKQSGDSWQNTLKKPTEVIRFGRLYQPEAICLNADGDQIYISSEKLPAKLLRIKLP